VLHAFLLRQHFISRHCTRKKSTYYEYEEQGELERPPPHPQRPGPPTEKHAADHGVAEIDNNEDPETFPGVVVEEKTVGVGVEDPQGTVDAVSATKTNVGRRH